MFSYDLLPRLFRLASGFAIRGPVAAIGLYELSRGRERGDHVTWLSTTRSACCARRPCRRSSAWARCSWPGFFLWLGAAYEIYLATLGGAPPQTIAAFERSVFTTAGGWTMIAAGVGVGFVFALVAFVVSAVSFPLLLDRDVTIRAAVGASLGAIRTNPGVMLTCAAIVAIALALGSLPGLVGLIFVVPMLGHATWRLYRKLIA